MSSLLTDAQRAELNDGITRSLTSGVRGRGGKLELLRKALQRHVSQWICLGGPGGPAMRALAHYLLAEDTRIRAEIAAAEKRSAT